MNTKFEDLVQNLDKHFKSLDLEFFIIGAKARDLISIHARIPLSARVTQDVDFGVLVDSWETLEKLRELFKEDPDIRLHSEANKVRYYYNGTPFDIVPFGGIEDNHKVSWPPFYDCVMTVVGYDSALEAASDITVGLSVVKIITPEMLVALKIISWDENPERDKDAKDIGYILDRYQTIEPTAYEYIMEHHIDIVEHFDYDDYLASIALAGYRIRNSSTADLYGNIIEILNLKKEKLARAMVKTPSSDIESEELGLLSIINALEYGINH